ncbi:hypothetical protein EDD11_005348 [Mortierella claussenii]|nr:hypothetical protein EDD11_005348 [Mortierella claussenii]
MAFDSTAAPACPSTTSVPPSAAPAAMPTARSCGKKPRRLLASLLGALTLSSILESPLSFGGVSIATALPISIMVQQQHYTPYLSNGQRATKWTASAEAVLDTTTTKQPKLDIFQDRFLDMAARISGKSRAQIVEVVRKENESIEWMTKHQDQQERKDSMFVPYVRHGGRFEGGDHISDCQHPHVHGLPGSHEGNSRMDKGTPEATGHRSGTGSKTGTLEVDCIKCSDSSMVNHAWVPDGDYGSGYKGPGEQTRSGPAGYVRVPKSTPAIFYVPHQDDDALAMALSIREHVESGRKVIVHLYSDGVNPLLRDIVAGDAPDTLTCHPPHKFNLTLEDEVTGRTHEFRNSLKALGVKDENIFETGWSDTEPFKDFNTFKNRLRHLIVEYEEKYPGASHKCISGEYDQDSSGRNPTHLACWDVATELVKDHPNGWPSSQQLWDFRFFRTYTYYKPAEKRSAQFIHSMPQYLGFKQLALDQYKRFEPSIGELAWGYHSVRILIDASYNSPLLFTDMLDNDPTNPINWGSEGDQDYEEKERKLHPGVAPGEVTYDEQQRRLREKPWKQHRPVDYQDMRKEKNDHIGEGDRDGGIDHVFMELPFELEARVEGLVEGQGGRIDMTHTERASGDAFLKSFEEAIKKPEGRGYGTRLHHSAVHAV